MAAINYTDPDADVPSPIDLRREEDARAWVEQADKDRPWRSVLRLRFAELIRALPAGVNVLELGSGPGLLAECILERCSNVTSYTLFDFSAPMLSMSRARLQKFECARFVDGDFKSANWANALQPPYSAVVAMQSVHEIRHKRHVPGLYREVRQLLAPGGMLMVCDGVPRDTSLRWTSLCMTPEEQFAAFAGAGFTDIALDCAIEQKVLVTGKV
ncbi:MAG TPA: class I SAM-dependent methyltransferase [Polyangiaceae bacterium]|jgi:ubiquinone/menaquinone biosynthesis C-methylase UbiE|nr:class I SAM-dependent methyltransferase [Polyangiaceae bacterium]